MYNRSHTNDSSSSSAITPLAVHNAFVRLINYYYIKGFGNLAENPSLKTREEDLGVFFREDIKENIDFLIPYAKSIHNLHELSNVNNPKSETKIREPIAAIGTSINRLVLPTDSCGQSANDTARIFLGEENDELVPNRKNIYSFNKFENEDNTMMAEVMSFDSPVLIRIEVKRLQHGKEITTHSYCALVAEEKNELGVSTYQAYFGLYTLAEWFNDPKFKTQPINFESYIKQLENLTSENAAIRKETYGKLYRLTGSEGEVPNKSQLHIYYKMLPINLSKAMDNINTRMDVARKIENEIIANNNGQSITPIEYMKNICWRSFTDYPQEKIQNIRNVVDAYQTEIQTTLDGFNRLSLIPNNTISGGSIIQPVISAGNPSESTSLPAATNDSPEENKKDLASTMRR
jgi:hypothetical protein